MTTKICCYKPIVCIAFSAFTVTLSVFDVSLLICITQYLVTNRRIFPLMLWMKPPHQWHQLRHSTLPLRAHQTSGTMYHQVFCFFFHHDAAKLSYVILFIALSREPHCVALYDFNAEGPGELSIRIDDVIMLVEKVDADWIKGRLRGQEGIFPSGFVEIKIDLPPKSKISTSAPPPSARPGTGKKLLYIKIISVHIHSSLPGGGGGGVALSTALYDFDGQEGELSFKVCTTEVTSFS